MAQMHDQYDKFCKTQAAGELMPKSPKMNLDKKPIQKKFEDPEFIEVRDMQRKLASQNRKKRRSISTEKKQPVKGKKIDYSLEVPKELQGKEMKGLYHPAFEQLD